ncbi:MAG: RNA polymerase sigma factor [Flavobacteriales bacterium]|nr:RNA polymerase sigma factor [Flavobacteriales bacterium]
MNLVDFEKDILPLKDKIFRFAKRLLSTQMEAEDTTQEVFLRLWSKREVLNKYSSVEALAMTMTRNICLDQIRFKKRKTVELHDNVAISDYTPLKHTEISDSIMLMNQILATLPEQQKTIIQLREVEGYEFEEISRIMEMNVNTIRVNLSRARQKVKKN